MISDRKRVEKMGVTPQGSESATDFLLSKVASLDFDTILSSLEISLATIQVKFDQEFQNSFQSLCYLERLNNLNGPLSFIKEDDSGPRNAIEEQRYFS